MAEGVPWQTLAALLELEKSTITAYAKEGVFIKTGRNKYLLAPSVRNYVRKLREIAAGRQGDQLNAVDENARLKIVQRRNLELKNAALEGSLVPVEAASDFVRRVNGRSSHRVQMEFQDLRKRYWGRHFWARGYFSTTATSRTMS